MRSLRCKRDLTPKQEGPATYAEGEEGEENCRKHSGVCVPSFPRIAILESLSVLLMQISFPRATSEA